MKFEITILGSNSAFPTHQRNPSSQILNHAEQLYLIDCGEGTQMRLDACRIKRARINHVFISHLHGDHVFGLPGLITSYSHLQRHNPLEIYGPVGIRKFLDTIFRLSESRINYPLKIHEIQSKDKLKIFENKYLKIYAFPLKHRIQTYGYAFVEKRGQLRIDKRAVALYSLDPSQIVAIKNGENYKSPAGTIIENKDLTVPPRPVRSYYYCSDTEYDVSLAPIIHKANLLYHEATFLHDLQDKAVQSMHSTAREAAQLACLAQVQSLLLGHFSSRYMNLDPLLDEARQHFPNAQLAIEGNLYEVPYED